MEAHSICPPSVAEADTDNYISSIPKISSISDADTVINTNNTNSSQIEGNLEEDETLKGLLTDEYCHVCDAVLLFESQRVSHYEGKKHAQKLRLYLQAKRDEKRNKDTGGSQRSIAMDKHRFCELCNMVFSSPVVARSHYCGKVHAKNLRKQGLYPTTLLTDTTPQTTLSSSTPAPSYADPKTAEEGNEESGSDPPASTDVDLSDATKHCRLCAASFNNPHMALQHYNGRKHQRNHFRQQLLKELGDDHMQANSLTCPICSIELNSVEMYQAHMQGNKHQTREKKVLDLCKSQKKVYSSFTDELADYVQVQKARGLAPKTSVGDQANEEQEENEDEERGGNQNWCEGPEFNTTPPNLPPSLKPLNPPLAFYPPAVWPPPYQGAPSNSGFGGQTHGWGPAFPQLPPQPLLPGLGVQRSTDRPSARKRTRERSSSSSSYTSSSSSYSSSSSSYSSTSDSSGSENRHRERKRRKGKSRRERGRRSREDVEESRRRKRARQMKDESDGKKRREDGAEVEEDDKRRSGKRRGKSGRRGGKRRREDNREDYRAKNVDDEETGGGKMEGGEETIVHVQPETNQGTEEKEEQSVPHKPKHRKEKKKVKEKADNRTEEEKLWDESILGL